MKVRPFVLLSASVLNAVHRRLLEAVEDWRLDWGLDTLGIQIECIRAWEAEPVQASQHWQRHYAEGQKSVWIAWQPECAKYIQRQLFPPDQRHVLHPRSTSSLAAEGADKALIALSDRIADAAGLLEAQARNRDIPPVALGAQGSGAVCARIKLGELSALCLISHDCVRAMSHKPVQKAGTSLPAANLKKVLRALPITLPIEIGQVEVEVGALVTLAVGDVIRLQTSVDKPLTVYGPEGNRLFDGYLGTLEKSVALEVVRHDK